MTLVKVILRSLLGLIFVVFGSNIFLHFLPNPPLTPAAADFFTALFKSGYFIPMLGATQVVSGALLLTGMMVPFALTLIAPVIVNIFLFHLFLAPDGLAIALVVVVLELVLVWMHRDAFAPLFASGNREAARGTMGATARA
jgi:putative oxidoreductase